MNKNFIKIPILIISFFAFINTSVNNTEAFLDSDLGINLYKDLDSGLNDFEEKAYIYELSGQEKKDIAENINKILSNKKIGECLKSNITASQIEKIANGNIKILTDNIKEECYDSENNSFDNKKIGELIYEINKLKIYYQNKAKQKADTLQELSRIGMYSDGNTNNSPFDLISDLDDINKILFIDKIDYETEDYDFLNKYEEKLSNIKDDLIGSIRGDGNGGGGNGNNKDNGGENGNNKDNNGNNNGENGEGNKQDNNGNNKDNGGENGNNDGNNYMCPDYSDSGLSNSGIKNILENYNNNSNKNNGNNNSKNKNGGHKKLNDSNKIKVPQSGMLSSNFDSQLVDNNIGLYKKINDNSIWNCNQYFCITVDFIVRNMRALDYSTNHSIQNIIETSNKHLKKAANTSLVQSKMTTNNFEISLRDLDLPNMFHMGIMISFKSPPLLDLEKNTENIDEKSNNNIENKLIEKYKLLGLDYFKANNLNLFKGNLKTIKSMIEATENKAPRVLELEKELKELNNLRSKMLNYNKQVVHKKINNDIIKDFDRQFVEIQQFNINLMDYVYHLDEIVKKLKEIPIYSG